MTLNIWKFAKLIKGFFDFQQTFVSGKKISYLIIFQIPSTTLNGIKEKNCAMPKHAEMSMPITYINEVHNT